MPVHYSEERSNVYQLKLTTELGSEHVVVVLQETVQQSGDLQAGDVLPVALQRHGLDCGPTSTRET